MTTKTNKPVMAELLVRHVFGEAENFERLCAQRGISVEEAISQALRDWVGPGLSVVKAEPQLMNPTLGLLPDPSDCPVGQEQHWIGVCEHDLNVLRSKQQLCFREQDRAGVTATTRTIETYIQTIASLKDRVA
jgi:hypothetical protein